MMQALKAHQRSGKASGTGSATLPATVQQVGVVAVFVQAEQDAARTYRAAEKAASTRRAYRSDFRIFAAWCRARGASHLPADPETVATFISSEADGGTKVSTIGRRLAAIRYAHRLAGHPTPTDAETVAVTMRGIRRVIGTARTKKAPATAPVVEKMLEHVLPDSLTCRRDRALLLLGFAGALRRSELVALEVADLDRSDAGLRVTIRRSKTDQEGHGQTIGIPAGGKLDVVGAVVAWIEAAGITGGPIFRPVNRHGQVLPMALTGTTVAAIVKAYAGRAGFDPALFAGHSLRRGFLTSAAQHGATLAKMKAVSGHKSTDVLMGYVDDAEMF
ncbi:MAG: site-specific integrase, partial [Janthinobacterium lividum]